MDTQAGAQAIPPQPPRGLSPPSPRRRNLPLDPSWPDEETYVQSLLALITNSTSTNTSTSTRTSDNTQPDPNSKSNSESKCNNSNNNPLFLNLCGGRGFHIVDFLTTTGGWGDKGERAKDGGGGGNEEEEGGEVEEEEKAANNSLYATIIPREWRRWFDRDDVDVQRVLDVVLREDHRQQKQQQRRQQQQQQRNEEQETSTERVGLSRSDEEGGGGGEQRDRKGEEEKEKEKEKEKGRRSPPPPQSLIDYILLVRRHSLLRDPRHTQTQHSQSQSQNPPKPSTLPLPLPRQLTTSLSPKKVHEVHHLSAYLHHLSSVIVPLETGYQHDAAVSTMLDLGCGRNYLGRVLASEGFGYRVLAVERRGRCLVGARGLDLRVAGAGMGMGGGGGGKVVEEEEKEEGLNRVKGRVMRNKKEFRRRRGQKRLGLVSGGNDDEGDGDGFKLDDRGYNRSIDNQAEDNDDDDGYDDNNTDPSTILRGGGGGGGGGRITYIQREIKGGFVQDMIDNLSVSNAKEEEDKKEKRRKEMEKEKKDNKNRRISASSKSPSLDETPTRRSTSTSPKSPTSKPWNPTPSPNSMVVSLHSCGDLSHHGLRTLSPGLNPSVAAVALIGCCYNLLSQGVRCRRRRLRQRRRTLDGEKKKIVDPGSDGELDADADADADVEDHGFPMSDRLRNFVYPDGSVGIRLSMTARMMAVQAPYNWGRDDSEAFFTRHFYRALLQRILMDIGVVSPPPASSSQLPIRERRRRQSLGVRDTAELDESHRGTTPLIVGSLPKSAFTSFTTYVHAALKKLARHDEVGQSISSKSSTLTDSFVQGYETLFAYARKQLAITWSLMAFSAGVVESLIVVDRWLWLREQVGWVGKCWVEPVFDYSLSPRNLIVVGIREGKKDAAERNQREAAQDDSSLLR